MSIILFYALLLPFSLYFLLLGVVRFCSCCLPNQPSLSFFFLIHAPPTNTSGSAFVRRESIILLHPPTFCPLSPFLSLPFSSTISLLSTCPSPIFINIVLMIPDGLTCTLWGRSVSVFFQGCAWVVLCVCVSNVCVHAGLLGTCMHHGVHICACLCLHVCEYTCSYQTASFSPSSRLLCSVLTICIRKPAIELLRPQLKM